MAWFDGVGLNANQSQRFEEQGLREKLRGILSDQKRIGSVIASHTNLTDRQVAALFRQAQTKDAAYALDKGIIHEVRDVQIPRHVQKEWPDLDAEFLR